MLFLMRISLFRKPLRYAVLRNTLNCWICVRQLARYSTGDERESKFTVTANMGQVQTNNRLDEMIGSSLSYGPSSNKQ